jgi:phosphomannomutase
MNTLSCFKSYDIRGKLGDELNTDIAYRIGRAFGQQLKPKSVVVGGDIRLTSAELKQAVAQGLMDAGVDVIDLGLTGTEEIYFAVSYLDIDGGIEVTASHNPIDYNGMKLVGKNSRPISRTSGLGEIQTLVEENNYPPVEKKGKFSQQSLIAPYVDHLLSFIDLKTLKPLRLVTNPGNGGAGHVIDAIEQQFKQLEVPIEFIKIHHDPDGTFPNGIPNPLLPENRSHTANAVKEFKADMGLAWDGDFDRCFLFDETGQFIEGYYIVGLLAQAFLQQKPNQKIIHDPRLTWNTLDVVKKNQGQAIQSQTGHAFMKERMRQENAIYGGEMSAHHYFRDFSYCDSGMIPWLLVIELLGREQKKLSQLIQEMEAAYPCSGEINYKVENAAKIMENVQEHFSNLTPNLDTTDGLSLEFDDWRFNLRCSNTEPLLRLNVEARKDKNIVRTRVREIEQIIKNGALHL